MKNLILIAVSLISLSAVAAEKSVYVCTQVDAKGAKPVSLYAKVSHEFKLRDGGRAADVFSLTGLNLNTSPAIVKIDFSDAIELENDTAQFYQAAANGQDAIQFSLTLRDSRSILSLHYQDIQVDNIWVNCRLSN